MLVSARTDWIAEARQLASQARDPAPHYQHSKVGYNYRLSNLLAAIGRGQLRVLAERVAARRRNFDAYRAALGDLPGWSFMPEASTGTCTCSLSFPSVPSMVARSAALSSSPVCACRAAPPSTQAIGRG